MADIFISYSRKDIAFARLIYQSLQDSGLDTWIDWEGIPVGEQWWTEIRQAIENSNVFMFIISQHSVGSAVCKDEINIALQNNKRVIPIIIDQLAADSINEFIPDLTKIQWIVFQRGNTFEIDDLQELQSDQSDDQRIAKAKLPQFYEAIQKLNTVIHTDWEWVKYHTQLQNEAHRWENNQRHVSYLLRGEALEQAEQSLLSTTQKDPLLTALQVEFINESRKEEKLQQEEKLNLQKRSTQRLRWVIATIVVGLVIAVFLGVNWLDQSNRAKTAENEAILQRDEARQQAQISLSRQLALQSISFSQNNYELQALLSLESLNTADTTDAKAALLTTLQKYPRMLKVLRNHLEFVGSVVYTPDGKLLLSGSNDSTLRIWNVEDPLTAFEISKVVMKNEEIVDSMAIRSDGKFVAIGKYISTDDSANQNIQLIDITDPNNPRVIEYSDDPTLGCGSSLDFSPDGKTLAAACEDKTIRFWDVTNPESPKILGLPITGMTEMINSIVFNPDGNILASGSQDGTIRLWDVSDPLEINMLSVVQNTIVSHLAFLPGGNTLASSTSVDDIYLWDVSDPKTPTQRGKLTGSIYSAIAFSPDGMLFASSGPDNTIHIWNTQNTSSQMTLEGHSDRVTSLNFSPDGKTLSSGSYDGKVILWDVTDLNNRQILSKTISGTSCIIQKVAYRPDGKILAAACSDSTLRLWDATKPLEIEPIGNPFIGNQGLGISIAFSPDGKTLATGGDDKKIFLWDVTDPKSPKIIGQPLAEHTDSIYSVDISPNGKVLASASKDNTVRFWDISNLESPKIISVIFPPQIKEGCHTLAFSPDGNTLATGGWDGIILLWDVSDASSPKPIGQPLQGHTDPINSLAFSYDGQVLASGSDDATIRLWDVSVLSSPKPLGQSLIGHTSDVNSVAFSPDGKTLASGSLDDTIRLWNVSDPKRTQTGDISLFGHTHFVFDVAFSPDGKTLASGSADENIRLWNMDVDSWKSQECLILNQNMTYSDWKRYLPNRPYQFTCNYLPFSDSTFREYLTLANDALIDDDRSTAELAYTNAIQKANGSDNPGYHNDICWFGSIDGFAQQVLPECDKAVSLAKENNNPNLPSYLDSRGLARVLTGDFNDAISDFQEFVDWTKQAGEFDSYGQKREAWIADLKKGINPFDSETLAELRSE